MLISHLIISFFASFSFSVLMNVPRKAMINCGLAGSAGWLVYQGLVTLTSNIVFSSLIGTVIVAMLSHYFAVKKKMPVIVFALPGIIALVPGGVAFQAFQKLENQLYSEAVALALQTIMIGGAIALGLVLTEVTIRQIKGYHQKKQR